MEGNTTVEAIKARFEAIYIKYIKSKDAQKKELIETFNKIDSKSRPVDGSDEHSYVKDVLDSLPYVGTGFCVIMFYMYLHMNGYIADASLKEMIDGLGK